MARWVAFMAIGVVLAFAGGEKQPSPSGVRPETVQKELKLGANEVESLVRAVLETDRSGCQGERGQSHQFPLISSWHKQVPPVLVIQLTGVCAPLPLEMKWETTLYFKGKKCRMSIQVVVVPRLKFTKKKISFSFINSEPSRVPFMKDSPLQDGKNGPQFYLTPASQKEPGLEIEVEGRTFRGLAAWLAVNECCALLSGTSPHSSCSPPDLEAIPAVFTLYDGESFVTPSTRYELEIKRDKTGNWTACLRATEINL